MTELIRFCRLGRCKGTNVSTKVSGARSHKRNSSGLSSEKIEGSMVRGVIPPTAVPHSVLLDRSTGTRLRPTFS
jgi:hypothetical protein